MAQFRATIQGNRGEASRFGTKNSGISANINGWNKGVEVLAYYDNELQQNCFMVSMTGGSNKKDRPVIIAKFNEDGENL